jgi:nucleotide-binding universal stress UspA family protein
MKTYLVPTDFSEHAENALHFAILLAQKQKANILLMHAIQPPIPVASEPFNVMQIEKEQLRKEAEHNLRSQAIKIKHAGGIKYDILITEGEPVDAIIKAARNKRTNMIIMGTQGAGSFEGVIFGSVASHIIRKAEQPVLAIPVEAVFSHEIKKITFATDYRDSDLRAIGHLAGIAFNLNAQLNILHVSEENIEPDKEMKLMSDFMNKVTKEVDYNNLSFQVLQGKHVEERLEKYMEDESTDLLVVSTRHRFFLERLFKSSLAKQLVQKTTIPVMAYHYNPKGEIKIFS